MMVPSRSRKAAGLATQRCDDDLDLFGKDRPRVQQHSTPRDARDNRWIVGAEPLGQGFVGEPGEPGPQLGTRERAAPDFRVAFDQLASEPRCALADTLLDRKSTRLNSSHLGISYAVFCLKKKKT